MGLTTPTTGPTNQNPTELIDTKVLQFLNLEKADYEISDDKPKSSIERTGWFTLILAGSCFLFFWLFTDCLNLGYSEEIEPSFVPSYLVKNSVLASTASSTTSSAPAVTTSAVLEDFQVAQPVLFPSSAVDETVSSNGSENTTSVATTESSSNCQVLLMEHSFGFSYGLPFVGNYTPPPCKFNRVTMNFTVTSQGRQFDRLALMYFNDTEIWRTSTAEPTSFGIRWEYDKDMTEFMYFWNSPQKIIFDLGNLIDSTYTGYYNTTLTATFFTSQDTVEPASLIIPISARQGAENGASLFTVPSQNASNTISFPRNANRAVFSVSACGQAAEEFWWSNVLQSNIDTFDPYDGTLYGYSPFREVQILIDGQLAGVHWPFPVIFTGGVVPGLWRPIVGIDAFDLREHEIDITPWLAVLSDGKEHTFEIRVAGIDDHGGTGTLTETVGSSWYVTGKIFVWQDDPSSITTGRAPTILLPAPVITTSQSHTSDSTGANETLTYTTDVSRTLSISTLLTTGGTTRLVSWTQSLSTTNYGLYTQYGAVQVTNQTTNGLDQSAGGVYYKSSYSYPIWANSSYIVQPSGNYTIDAVIYRGLDLSISGTPVFPTGLQPFANIPNTESLVAGLSGTQLSTTQNGTAHYFASPSAGISSGFGSTNQEFTFTGLDTAAGVTDTELYYRNVTAVNATVVSDYERLSGVEIASFIKVANSAPALPMVFEGYVSPKEILGRGPGDAKEGLMGSG